MTLNLSLCPYPPQHGGSGKDSSPCSQYGFPVLEGESEFYYQRVIIVHFGMSGSLEGMTQGVCLFLLNLGFSQDRKGDIQGTFLRNTERKMNKLPPPGAAGNSVGENSSHA